MPCSSPLSVPIQLVFNPLHCPLVWPKRQQLLYEGLMGDSVEDLPVVQVDSIYCSPLIYQANQSHHQKFIKLVNNYFLLVKPCWLLLIIFLSLRCLEMDSRISWFIIFIRTELVFKYDFSLVYRYLFRRVLTMFSHRHFYLLKRFVSE